MANEEHLDILKQGVKTWNQWRQEHPHIRPFLREAVLRGLKASDIDLSKANLIRADLRGSDLNGANLSRARLYGANLSGAQLSRANLQGARFIGTDLSGTNLSGADLHDANLSWANLSDANLSNTILTGSRIYASSAWNVKLEGAIQDKLIITPEKEPIITVDDLEVAQFIYLLLNSQKIRRVIDTITSQVV